MDFSKSVSLLYQLLIIIISDIIITPLNFCYHWNFAKLDVDECSADPSPCDATNGDCTNNDGSYTCSCDDGYMLNGDGRTCDRML